MIHGRELSAQIRYPMAMAPVFSRRSLLVVGLALAAAGSGYAFADDPNDNDDDGRGHDRDPRALEEGGARPLAEILKLCGASWTAKWSASSLTARRVTMPTNSR